jgi:hypothetical protein
MDSDHSGLRVVSHALRPEDVKDVWTEYNPTSKSFHANYGIHVQCFNNGTAARSPPTPPHYSVNFDLELVGYTAEKFGELEQYDLSVRQSLFRTGILSTCFSC